MNWYHLEHWVSLAELVLEHTSVPQLHEGRPLAMPYCDNVRAIGLDEDLCNNSKDTICNALTGVGFSMREDEPAATTFNTLGGVVDGDLGQARATSARMWNLILAFMHIRRGPIHPEVVQRLLGHSMVVCVLNRSGMAIFHQLYKFALGNSGPRPLNLKERQECYIFAGIVPLLHADLRRPWGNDVHCTDASPDGFGICSMTASLSEVSHVGRWNERWRYRRLPPEQWQPRKRALGADLLGDISTVVGNLSAVDECADYGDNPVTTRCLKRFPIACWIPNAGLLRRWVNGNTLKSTSRSKKEDQWYFAHEGFHAAVGIGGSVIFGLGGQFGFGFGC